MIFHCQDIYKMFKDIQQPGFELLLNKTKKGGNLATLAKAKKEIVMLKEKIKSFQFATKQELQEWLSNVVPLEQSYMKSENFHFSAFRNGWIYDTDINLTGNTKVKNFPPGLILLTGALIINNSEVESLGAIVEIGYLNISGQNCLTEFKFLTRVGQSLTLVGSSNFKCLGSLNEIAGRAHFNQSVLEDLGELEVIGLYASFDQSKVRSLKKLKTIGGDVSFRDSEVVDFGALRYIGGAAYLERSKITAEAIPDDLVIGGNVFYDRYNYRLGNKLKMLKMKGNIKGLVLAV